MTNPTPLPPPRAADPAVVSRPRARAPRRPRVLLALGAGFEADTLDAARRALEAGGVDVALARSVDAALEAGMSELPDALIVDPRLPAADVVATLRFAGYRGPVLAWSPAAAGSGAGAPGARGGPAPVAPAFDADAFLAAPLDVAALLAGPLAARATDDADDGFDELPEYAEMRARFERELPGTLAHVVSLARRGEWGGLGRALHRLKGHAGAFGRPDLTRDAQRAGALLEQGRPDDAARICESIAAPFLAPSGVPTTAPPAATGGDSARGDFT